MPSPSPSSSTELPEESSNPSGPNPVLIALTMIAAYLAYRWGFAVLRLPVGTPAALILGAGALSAFLAIGLPVATLRALVQHRLSLPAMVGLVVGGLALWLGWNLMPLNPRSLPRWLLHGILALQDLGKILAAAGVGVALARPLREPNILLPAGVFAAFADFVVVKFGTVKQALSTSKGQAVVQAVSAKVPALHPAIPSLTIGPADFLALGFLLAAVHKFGFEPRRNAVSLTVVLALSLILVAFTGWPIPALAPMGITFVVVNRRHFRLTRDEIIGTLAVLLAAGALFLGYFLFLFPRR